MTTVDVSWQAEFEAWLAPFLDRLGRKEQRRWAPVYLQGLIGPGGRKSVEPMAARVAPGDVQQLHHFVAASPWATAPCQYRTNFPRKCRSKFPHVVGFVDQVLAGAGSLGLGGRPRRRGGGPGSGGVMRALERMCSGTSSAC